MNSWFQTSGQSVAYQDRLVELNANSPFLKSYHHLTAMDELAALLEHDRWFGLPPPEPFNRSNAPIASSSKHDYWGTVLNGSPSSSAITKTGKTAVRSIDYWATVLNGRPSSTASSSVTQTKTEGRLSSHLTERELEDHVSMRPESNARGQFVIFLGFVSEPFPEACTGPERVKRPRKRVAPYDAPAEKQEGAKNRSPLSRPALPTDMFRYGNANSPNGLGNKR